MPFRLLAVIQVKMKFIRLPRCRKPLGVGAMRLTGLKGKLVIDGTLLFRLLKLFNKKMSY
jgi:hypothetical protein